MQAAQTIERPKGLGAGSKETSKAENVATPAPLNAAERAREILNRHDGDVDAAMVEWMEEIEDDKALYAAVIGPHVETLARGGLLSVRIAMRAQAWNGPRVLTKEEHAERAKASAATRRANTNHARAMILDMPLPVTGKPLRHATAEDLRGAATYYRGLEGHYAQKAGFIEKLEKGVGKGTVEAKFSEAKLREIQGSVV